MAARIFVGLDYQCTEADLLDKFEQWGTVKEIFIPKDFRGRCRGYAFVEYENSQDCAAAIEGADRTQLFGRTIRLEPATGTRRRPGEFRDGRPQNTNGYREFSTLRPAVAGFAVPFRRPVQLNQVNALVGRRMFGLAASLLTRRRVM